MSQREVGSAYFFLYCVTKAFLAEVQRNRGLLQKRKFRLEVIGRFRDAIQRIDRAGEPLSVIYPPTDAIGKVAVRRKGTVAAPRCRGAK
jgi:hypothetical protein